MRFVTWNDDKGYIRRALIRDLDPDDRAPEIGIPVEPPDLDLLDLTAISAKFPELDVTEFKRKLHNRLVQTGLFNWKDVQRSQKGLSNAVMFACKNRELLKLIKRPLVALYRQ